MDEELLAAEVMVAAMAAAELVVSVAAGDRHAADRLEMTSTLTVPALSPARGLLHPHTAVVVVVRARTIHDPHLRLDEGETTEEAATMIDVEALVMIATTTETVADLVAAGGDTVRDSVGNRLEVAFTTAIDLVLLVIGMRNPRKGQHISCREMIIIMKKMAYHFHSQNEKCLGGQHHGGGPHHGKGQRHSLLSRSNC